MLLLEIAAQGVKGVAPASGRLTLRAGYNVVPAEGPALRRLLEALLYPNPRDADSLPRTAPGTSGAPVRAGVTLVGNDQVTYRLVRDFGAGCQLHRFDPQQRSFALVSQDLAEIAAHLVGPAGLPSRGRLAALLCLGAAELPSKAGAAGLGAASVVPSAPRRQTPEQAEKRLAELRAELERARKAEKAQYRMDGLQSRLYKAEEALREGARVREGLAAAEGALHELAAVDAVATRLGDVQARLAQHAKAMARRDEGLAKVDSERQVLAGIAGQGAPLAPWKEPRVLGAAAAGLLLFALGMVGAAQGSDLRYLALLDIPVFGLGAWFALRNVDRHEELARMGRRQRVVEERERKVKEQFERDTAELRQAVQELGLPGLTELQDLVGKLADARATHAEWRERLAAWEAQPETRDARAERDRVEAELREAESDLASEAGGYVRDPRTIEAELGRATQEAAVPPEEEAVTAPAAPAVEPLRGLLERAAAELSLTPSALARSLLARASQAMAALSGQRCTGLSVDDRGTLMALVSGRPQPSLGLPPADRDLCFLALRLALVEQEIGAGKAVALVDEVFAGLPEGARRMAARLLKQAARGGQILHATRDPAFREAADHAA
ncbi:MAG: hypothetical protein HZB56_23595 [Deltaproteobacteria bacterium]|nr:hypothetical protein [Deltaproteobacteria bacterium]